MTGIGKALAVLWAIIMDVGFNIGRLRLVLGSVRCVTSDFGIESMLADCPDILPEVMAAVGIGAGFQNIPREPYLLPRALLMPGWSHLWDGVLRSICNRLGFPLVFKHVI
jgi:hypothetical protein